MSLKPKRISGDRARGAFKAAKDRLKKRKHEVGELKKRVLESQLAGSLSKAQKSASGLSRRGASVLRVLRERGHDREKKEAPSGTDTPSPKRRDVSKKPEAQHPVIHLEKSSKPNGRPLTAGDHRARRAFLEHFKSAERKEWGLTNNELRFRRKLIEMWFELTQELKRKGKLSPAKELIFEVVMALVTEMYGEPYVKC